MNPEVKTVDVEANTEGYTDAPNTPKHKVFSNIFSGLRDVGIKIEVDGKPVDEFILTLPLEEAEKFTEDVLKTLIHLIATPENLEIALGEKLEQG